MKTFYICTFSLLTLSSIFLLGCGNKSDDFLQRGILNKKEHNYKQALSDFNKAIELDSNNARAYLERVKIGCKAGFTEPIEHDVSKYIELTEHDLAIAHIGRALSKRLQQDFHSSFADLNKAIHIYPADVQSFAFKERFLIELGDSVQLKEFREGLDEQTRIRMKKSAEESIFPVNPTAPNKQNNDTGK